MANDSGFFETVLPKGRALLHSFSIPTAQLRENIGTSAASKLRGRKHLQESQRPLHQANCLVLHLQKQSAYYAHILQSNVLPLT